jgi:hypothetical protein
VAGALGRHAQALLAGEVDDLDNVGVRPRDRDRGWTLIDGEVPRAPRLVPAFVVRCVDLAIEAGSEASTSAAARSVISMAPMVGANADPAHQGIP